LGRQANDKVRGVSGGYTEPHRPRLIRVHSCPSVFIDPRNESGARYDPRFDYLSKPCDRLSRAGSSPHSQFP